MAIPTATVAAPISAAYAPSPYGAAAPVQYMQQPYGAAAPVQYMQQPYEAAAPVQYQQRSPSYVPPPIGMGTVPAVAMMPPTQKASFVAPSGMPGYGQPMMVAQQFAEASVPPPMPQRLTENMPDPEAIETQKRAYAAALDRQLQEAWVTVQKETAIEKQMVEFKLKKDIALHDLAVDEQLTQQLALVDEQATQAQCELKKALVDRNVQLNTQASALVAEYRQKQIIEDLAKRKLEFDRAFMGQEMQLAQQYNQEAARANAPTAVSVPAGYAAPAPVTNAVPVPAGYAAPAQYAQYAAAAPQYAYAAPGAAVYM